MTLPTTLPPPAVAPDPSTSPPAAAPPPDAASSRAVDASRQLTYVGLAFALVIVPFWWLVTHGTWGLLDAENYGNYYDHLARAMLEGRLDVPPQVIGGEAFVYDNKTYGYFGPGPAVLRIPLNRVWPDMFERWARVMLLAGCVVTLLFGYLILLSVRKWWIRPTTDSDAAEVVPVPPPRPRYTHYHGLLDAMFILSLGLGSTTIFLASRAYVYHEANMWGSAGAVVTAWCLVRYLTSPRWFWLPLAGLAAAFAFFSRPTIGAGALFACLLVCAALVVRATEDHRRRAIARVGAATRWGANLLALPTPRRPVWHAALIALVGAATVAAYFAMNWAKFRTLDGVPVKYYVQYLENPDRMRRTGGKQIHLANFRTCFVNTFSPTLIDFRPRFPWAYATNDDRKAVQYPEAKMDYLGETSGIPASMPALFLLSTVGLAFMFASRRPGVRRLRLPTLGMLVGGGLVLLTVSVQERYLHDFVPYLAVAGAAGVALLSSWRNRWASFPVTLVLLPLALYGVWVNTSFALVHEGEGVWGVDEDRRAAFRSLRDRVDALVLNDALAPIETETADQRPPERRGQLWTVRKTKSRYWFDGHLWQVLEAGEALGPIKLAITFGEQREPGKEEVLLTSGTTGAADFLFVRYEDDGRVSFGYDHWGTGGPIGRRFKVEPGKAYPLVLHLDAINRRVQVEFKDKPALLHRGTIYPSSPEKLTVGANPAGGHRTASFSGRLERAE